MTTVSMMRLWAVALFLFCGMQRVNPATTSLGLAQVTQVITVGENAEFQCRSTGNGADPRLEWLITYADGTTYENITYLATTINNNNLFDGDVLQSITYPIRNETIGKLIFCNSFNGTNYREQQVYTVIIQSTSVLGGSCSQTSDCGTLRASCDNQVCRCQTGYFDTNGVSTSGGSCQTPNTVGEICTVNVQGSCTDNSVCSSSTGRCVCNSGYTESSGSCVVFATLGGSCGSTLSCGITNAGCINGICQCLTNYFNNNGVCQLQSTVGQSCVTNIQDSCRDTSVCSSSTGTCVCISGYTESSGSCVLSTNLGGFCSQSSDCGTFGAFCNGFVCECQSGYYDTNGINQNGGSCETPKSLGQSCSYNIAGTCSAANSVCDANTITCQCNTPTYIQTGSNTCSLATANLGQSCGSTISCGTANAGCVNGICQCLSNYFNNGGTCQLQSTVGQSCNSNVQDSCRDNSACSSSTGTCVCISGYQQFSGSCVPNAGLGQSCSSFVPCTIANSQCIGGVCSCGSGYYAVGNTQCLPLGTYGSSCTQGTSSCSTGNLVCGSNSVCVCANGYTYSSSSGSCVQPTLGGSCTTAVGCLDTSSGGNTASPVCLNNFCACPNSQYYGSNNVCYLKATLGGSCLSTVSDSCMDPYAMCNGSPATCSCPGTVTSQGACTNSGVVCPANTQSPVTTSGTSSPLTPNIYVEHTCYVIDLYGSAFMPCVDTKGANAIQSGGWVKRNSAGQFETIPFSTNAFINGIASNPNLTISNAQVPYGGFYRCRLCYGSSFTACTDSADVEVKIRGAQITSVAVTTSDSSPNKGDFVTLTCSVVPSGTATSFSWRRNNIALGSTQATYTMASVSRLDAGSYTCSASNQYNPNSPVASPGLVLDVQYAPEYSLNGGGDTITVIADLETANEVLTCDIVGNPAVSVYTFTAADGTTVSGTTPQFTVTPTRGYGTYSCIATNGLGTSVPLYFEVQEAGDPNIGAATGGDGGISTGAIAAIVLGIIFLLLLILVIIICCCNYGPCRKKDKIEPEKVIAQPPVKPYIPRILVSDQGSTVSRKDVGIMMNGVSTDFEEPVYTPRYYLTPAKTAGPIISMRVDNIDQPRAHQLPALDTHYLYTDDEPKKKRKRRKKRRQHHEETERYAEVNPPDDDDDLVVIPEGGRSSRSRNNYYE